MNSARINTSFQAKFTPVFKHVRVYLGFSVLSQLSQKGAVTQDCTVVAHWKHRFPRSPKLSNVGPSQDLGGWLPVLVWATVQLRNALGVAQIYYTAVRLSGMRWLPLPGYVEPAKISRPAVAGQGDVIIATRLGKNTQKWSVSPLVPQMGGLE